MVGWIKNRWIVGWMDRQKKTNEKLMDIKIYEKQMAG